jgi:hypothetical protein
MKTKPIVVALLVITAVMVSASSALVIGRFSRHEIAARAFVSQSELMRGVAAGVAKATVRVLMCRL